MALGEPTVERLVCPACQGLECLTAREVRCFPLAHPTSPEGELRLEVQLSCEACQALVRLRLYESPRGASVQVERDDPEAESQEPPAP